MSKTIHLDCQHEDWILQNSCTSSYSGHSEKEKSEVGGGKAGGWVAEQPEADEISASSSPGGEKLGN